MKKTEILAITGLSLVILAACNTPAEPATDAMPPAPEPGNENQEIELNDDDMMKITIDGEEITIDDEEPMFDQILQNRIVFTNVAEGDNQGEGFYGVMEGETRVYANFMVEKLENDDYFYEGWLVCDNKPYSTGELFFFDGLYENIFVSSEVPDVCQEYVLTIEPNDGDPAPADHIMDGVFEGVAHTETSIDWNDERFELL